MTRLALVRVLLVCLAVLSGLAVTGSAPADRADDPRARSYIVDHLRPGATITRHVEVSNGTGARHRIDLYAGPAVIVDGTWSPLDEGTTSDLTSWTSIGRGRVAVAAGGTITVPVTITVPSDASAGERYAVLWAQVSTGRQGQVRMVSRVGIRVYLSVGPGGEPATDFTIDALSGARAPDGALQVLADVTNTGGRAVDLEGSLRLDDGPHALSAGPYPAELGTTLAPGDTGRVVVDLAADLPPGPWHTVLTLRSGTEQRSGAAELTFPAHGVGAPVQVESDPHRRWIWPTVGALALLTGVGVVWRLRARRRPVLD